MDSPSILGSPPFLVFIVGCLIAFSYPLSIYMHILQMKCFKIALMKLNSTNAIFFFFLHNAFKNVVCS